MIYYFEHNYGEIIRRAPYDSITHFVSGDKFVTAFTADSELLLNETLKEIAGNHPELVYTHRSTLVRADDIVYVAENKAGDRWMSRYKAILKSGVEVKVSRYEYKKIRDLINAREAA